MKLLIVESPTKAKTITSLLKSKYNVLSSFGHIRDLPKSEMGIDIENGFLPRYVVPREKSKTVAELKEAGKKADEIYFGTDADREGEAISWHLAHILNVDPKEAKRIVFHEITDEALEDAMKHPRPIDMNLVDAQQARRVLDRLVGYELSPFLWRKVAKGLSAGRVQSVAVRFIVERERELQAFKTEEYWSIEADLLKGRKPFRAKLISFDGKELGKMDIKTEKDAKKIAESLEGRKFKVADLAEKTIEKHPVAPLTTSSLQQEANKKLGFSAKQTMKLAQELYEGVSLGGGAAHGLITYMRTDSVMLSEKFTAQAKDWIRKNLGAPYIMEGGRKYTNKIRGAQEAHEAIRPTSAARTPDSVREFLNKNQARLYELIWRRAMATQAKPAIFKQTSVSIKAGEAEFRANGNVLVFDGFLKIYGVSSKDVILPQLAVGDELKLKEILPLQHFTEPPARYSDATLVKALEEQGIGRPSTYAPTISTIISRGYVDRDENKKLKPTDVAFLVNDLLVGNFPEIVDYQFTARVEDDLDAIAKGEKEWQPVIDGFYRPFSENLAQKYKDIKKADVLHEETKEICELCGSPMVVRLSRYGKFLACSAFPKCKFTMPMDGKKLEQEIKESDEICDKCGARMLIKEGKFGKFLGCSNYPNCRNMKPLNDDTGVLCPTCGGKVVARRTRRGRVFYGCSNYPKCNFALWSRPTGDKCPKCGSLLVDFRGKTKCSNAECK